MSDWGTTTPVRAVVTLATGKVYPGHLHLLDGVRAGVPESPLEMLNRSGAFVPLTLDDGTVFLVAKGQVATVRCEWPPEGLEVWEEPGRRAPLRVTLASGEELTGDVLVTGPVSHARPVDHLNAGGPFFQLDTGTGFRLVNRAHVSIVQPLQ